MKKSFPTSLVLLVLCGGMPAIAAPGMQSTPARYKVTPLAPVASAKGINDSTQVIGYAAEAVIWDKGTVRSVLMGGAESINELGQVVGHGPWQGSHIAVLWDDGIRKELPFMWATGINDYSEIVGYLNWSESVLWRNGIVTHLGSLGGGGTYAQAINNASQVVGDSNGHAFLWENGSMTDLGLLPPSEAEDTSYASGINNSGAVVGWSGRFSTDVSSTRAFIWRNGVMTALPSAGGGIIDQALAINDAGQVVGHSGTQWFGSGFAVLWDNGIPYNLNELIDVELEFPLWIAMSINNKGEIVANSADPNHPGVEYAFLLTPVSETPQGETEALAAAITDLSTTGVLSGGQATSLTALLRSGIQQMDRGNATAARNQLRGFIKEVNALMKSGKLSQAQGQPLVDEVNSIISRL